MLTCCCCCCSSQGKNLKIVFLHSQPPSQQQQRAHSSSTESHHENIKIIFQLYSTTHAHQSKNKKPSPQWPLKIISTLRFFFQWKKIIFVASFINTATEQTQHREEEEEKSKIRTQVNFMALNER